MTGARQPARGTPADSSRADAGLGFRSLVLAIVRRIPPGRVATYGDVARLAGRPQAAHAVGAIMRTCRDDRTPCHRVVAAGGRLGGYGDVPGLKRSLLEAEGVVISGTRIRNIGEVRWKNRSSP